MTIPMCAGRCSQGGAGHDDMTMQKQAKNPHHAMIPQSYDDMTKVMVSRARTCACFALFLSFLSISLTRSFKEYNHIVISIRNHCMMMVFYLKNARHIVITEGSHA